MERGAGVRAEVRSQRSKVTHQNRQERSSWHNSRECCRSCPIETRSLPTLTHVLPPISTSRFAPLCRSRPRGSVHSLLPSQLRQFGSGPLITRTAQCLRQLMQVRLGPALPSTRTIPDRTCSMSLALSLRSRDGPLRRGWTNGEESNKLNRSAHQHR